MQKLILLNSLSLMILFFLFTSIAFAQAVNISEPPGFKSSKAIPTEEFYFPESASSLQSPTTNSSDSALTTDSNNLESNILGAQSRNPAPIVTSQPSRILNFLVNFVGLLLLAGFGYWIYKNKKHFKVTNPLDSF